jgi:LPXTG-motif cell wall-anchored protein
VYEGLPWLYAVVGALAIGAGYRLRSTGALSTAISLAGLVGLIAGVAVWLRRRDYRAGRGDYPRDD